MAAIPVRLNVLYSGNAAPVAIAEDGCNGEIEIVRADSRREVIPSKVVTWR
jgi:hypothetical protein